MRHGHIALRPALKKEEMSLQHKQDSFRANLPVSDGFVRMFTRGTHQTAFTHRNRHKTASKEQTYFQSQYVQFTKH